MKKTFIFILAALLSLPIFSQVVYRGVVVDEDTQEPLIGVSVVDPRTNQGVLTALDGSFSYRFSQSTKELAVSYIGYTPKRVKITTSQSDIGTITLRSEAIGLKDVVVTSSIAIRRKTAVALSVIDPKIIETKLGTQEFPEILKSTPSVYATKGGGGYGDSRINLRGFASENIAIMVNGVPMNDMEWGGVYWSNWTGLSDVTRSLQVQRGLGASKIAAPSVGGSINIVTKSTEAKKGGSFYYGMGNNGYNKLSFNVSSGLTDNGWAVTVMGTKTWGDGYVQGTPFVGYSYFGNISKIINDNHQLSLTAFGAPQIHYQRKDKLLISEWAKIPESYRYQYNAGYGYDASGQFRSFNYNFYHKPQISLNHFWTINETSSLSTALYTSIGMGGGYTGIGSSRSDYYGAYGGLITQKYRRIDGTYDFEALMNANYNSQTGALTAIQRSNNNHNWYGILSTYTKKMGNFNLQAGVDIRYYKGIHTATVADLLGGKYVIDPQRAIDGMYKENLAWVNEKLTVGDVTYRNYDGYVAQVGGFAQLEYTLDKLNTFVSTSFNNNSYWRVEKFAALNEKSNIINKFGFGAKGGANYNLDEHNNLFTNIGYFSRTPFFSKGIFLNNQKSNAINQDAQNEKVFSVELGYGYRSSLFTANVNLYRTSWNDKTMIRAIDNADPERGTLNMTGVNALHQGVEVDMKLTPTRNLEITAMLSIGDWQWKNNATGYLYDAVGNAIDSKGNIVQTGTKEHAYVTLNLDGIKVGNSAQTTAAIGVNYKVLQNTTLGVDYTYYDRNYADYAVRIAKWGENNFTQPWMIPAAGVLDFNFNHHFKIGGLKTILYANVNNVLNANYITDANDGGSGTWDKATVYYGFGRTMSVGLKVRF